MSNVIPLQSGTPATPLPLPLSVEAEQALLGAILLNNEVLPAVQALVDAEHFSEELHRRIFKEAVDMVAAGQVASPITVLAFVRDQEIANGVTIGRYLARIAAEAVTVSQAPSFARTVLDLAQRRRLIGIFEAGAEQARTAGAGEDPAGLASVALTDLQAIAASSRTENTRRDVGESAAAIITRAREIMEGTRHDAGISTGLPDLDRDTGGFQPGTLWVLGGRPGQGKSVLATGFANKVASRGARQLRDALTATGSMLFSLELGEPQIMARLMADLAYRPGHPITYSQIVRGELDDNEVWCLEDAEKRLRKMPLALDVASRLSVQEIGARVRAEKARMARRGIRLGVVFIDYIKMVAASDRYRGNRVYEVGEISGGLKQLAKDEDLCVVLLAQLNRGSVAHDRKDKRPTLIDLRESGDLEADADVVAFIHREAYYLKESADYRNNDADTLQAYLDCQHAGEIIISKTRLGSTGTVPIWVNVGCSTFAAQARGEGML